MFVFVLAGSTLTVVEEIRHLRIAADSGYPPSASYKLAIKYMGLPVGVNPISIDRDDGGGVPKNTKRAAAYMRESDKGRAVRCQSVGEAVN